MFIDYGVSNSGELVYIGQVGRGATDLACPYCGGLLTAKKGRIKIAHFAHSGETCAAASRDQDAISLPAYDKFDLYLPGKVIEALQRFGDGLHSGRDIQLLLDHKLIKENEWNRSSGYDLTHKGKVPLGQLSLDLFNALQSELFAERHAELEAVADRLYRMAGPKAEIERLTAEIDQLSSQLGVAGESWHSPEDLKLRDLYNGRARLIRNRHILTVELPPEAEQRLDLPVALADLRLYRAQWQRVRSATLYFLSINGGQYYKIGVTTRTVEERLAEIVADLTPLIGVPAIEVIGTWLQRGNVELYFKFRYRDHQVELGELTEYFYFDDVAPVKRDLSRMKSTPPAELEAAILAGELSGIENRIRLDAVEDKRRAGIRAGMRRAARRGKAIGRPKGLASDDVVLAKYPEVIEALRSGLSLRQIAEQCDVAVNTVRKVEAALRRAEAVRS